MGKLIIAVGVLLFVVCLARCDDFELDDFDIQFHPNPGHGYGIKDDTFATSIRYDKRYTDGEIPDIMYNSGEDPVSVYVANAHSDSYSSSSAEEEEADGDGGGDGDGDEDDKKY